MGNFFIQKGYKEDLSNVPIQDGGFYVTIDDGKLYIDDRTQRLVANAYKADVLNGTFLPELPQAPVAADEYIPYSWEEINAIALSGHAQDWISVGALKSETLTEEVLGTTTHDIRVIGINEDNDESITFQTKNTLSKTLSFGSSALWSNSTARTQCQNYYNAFLGKGYIKTISKGTNTAYNSASLVYTDETVWLPSVHEMGGYEDYSYAPIAGEYTSGKSSTYSYYSTYASRVKTQGDSGSTVGYWLRSRSGKAENRTCYISLGGNATGGTYSGTRGLAPAFVIGNRTLYFPALTVYDIYPYLIPSGGITGQTLVKTAEGYEWQDNEGSVSWGSFTDLV